MPRSTLLRRRCRWQPQSKLTGGTRSISGSPKASSSKTSNGVTASTSKAPAGGEDAGPSVAARVTDDMTLDRKVLLPSHSLSLAEAHPSTSSEVNDEKPVCSSSPKLRASKSSPSRKRVGVGKGASSSPKRTLSDCQKLPYIDETNPSIDYIDDSTSPEDTLTAVITPNSTSIVITLPSSSSPSPTNPNKTLRMSPTSVNPNTLGVFPGNESRGIVAEKSDSSGTSSAVVGSTSGSPNSSPKKLSFVAPPDVIDGSFQKKEPKLHFTNLSSVQSKSQPSLHASSLRSSRYSLYSPYASAASFPAVHLAHMKQSKSSPNALSNLKKHHSFSSVTFNSQTNTFSTPKKHSAPARTMSSTTVSTKVRKGSVTGSTKTAIKKHHSFCSSSNYTSLQYGSLSCPSRYSFSSSPNRDYSSSGCRSHPVSPKRKASSVYMAVSSCICCR